jgi:hypothetical protein
VLVRVHATSVNPVDWHTLTTGSDLSVTSAVSGSLRLSGAGEWCCSSRSSTKRIWSSWRSFWRPGQ